MTYTTRTTCRVCGSANLEPLFSLGEQFVSDFVAADQVCAGPKVPIDIELCRDCTLIQAKHSPPAEKMYQRHYWYRSGTTKTMRDALADVVRAATSFVELGAGEAVLDIGSNDGTLLRCYDPHVFTVGVEPARNFADVGSRGINFLLNDFWSYDALKAAKIGGPTFAQFGKYKVVTAIGMFYDLEDPNQFIADVAKVLSRDGIFIAQLMCARNMFALKDVGNFAHEHLEFYTLKSLATLFDNQGLEIIDVEVNDVNGQSYRLYVRRKDGTIQVPSGAVDRMAKLGMEEKTLANPDWWRAWFDWLKVNRDLCVDFIRDAVRQGKRVWAFGASTKGNVILQWYHLDDLLIEAAVDRSPEKCCLYTVGSGIPIRSEEFFRAANPDYALVLPYAFLPEFMEREAEWRSRGGRFIVPLPEFRVV